MRESPGSAPGAATGPIPGAQPAGRGPRPGTPYWTRRAGATARPGRPGPRTAATARPLGCARQVARPGVRSAPGRADACGALGSGVPSGRATSTRGTVAAPPNPRTVLVASQDVAHPPQDRTTAYEKVQFTLLARVLFADFPGNPEKRGIKPTGGACEAERTPWARCRACTDARSLSDSVTSVSTSPMFCLTSGTEWL